MFRFEGITLVLRFFIQGLERLDIDYTLKPVLVQLFTDDRKFVKPCREPLTLFFCLVQRRAVETVLNK